MDSGTIAQHVFNYRPKKIGDGGRLRRCGEDFFSAETDHLWNTFKLRV
jgi:hypothetical protein